MKVYGLIGYPLTHSFSGSYFAGKFAAEGITGTCYRNFPLRSAGDLEKLFDENPGLAGLNVTIPYKETIIPHLHRVDETAAAIGAVNCITIGERGELTGYNTDAPAFRTSLMELIGDDRPYALILGTGGVSKAVVYVLGELGLDYRTVSRDRNKGDITYEQLTDASVSEHRLIINCTPLGTYPSVKELPPIPYDAVGEGHYLFDMVYNPAETAFIRTGRHKGARTMNGLKMLERQADLSWEIWNR